MNKREYVIKLLRKLRKYAFPTISKIKKFLHIISPLIESYFDAAKWYTDYECSKLSSKLDQYYKWEKHQSNISAE